MEACPLAPYSLSLRDNDFTSQPIWVAVKMLRRREIQFIGQDMGASPTWRCASMPVYFCRLLLWYFGECFAHLLDFKGRLWDCKLVLAFILMSWHSIGQLLVHQLRCYHDYCFAFCESTNFRIMLFLTFWLNLTIFASNVTNYICHIMIWQLMIMMWYYWVIFQA